MTSQSYGLSTKKEALDLINFEKLVVGKDDLGKYLDDMNLTVIKAHSNEFKSERSLKDQENSFVTARSEQKAKVQQERQKTRQSPFETVKSPQKSQQSLRQSPQRSLRQSPQQSLHQSPHSRQSAHQTLIHSLRQSLQQSLQRSPDNEADSRAGSQNFQRQQKQQENLSNRSSVMQDSFYTDPVSHKKVKRRLFERSDLDMSDNGNKGVTLYGMFKSNKANDEEASNMSQSFLTDASISAPQKAQQTTKMPVAHALPIVLAAQTPTTYIPVTQDQDQANNERMRFEKQKEAIQKNMELAQLNLEIKQKEKLLEQNLALQKSNQDVYFQKRQEINRNIMDKVRNKKYSGDGIYVLNQYFLENYDFFYQDFIGQTTEEKAYILIEMCERIRSKYESVKEIEDKTKKYLEKYSRETVSTETQEKTSNKITYSENIIDEMESRMYFILKEYYLIEKSNFVIDIINIGATVLQFIDDQIGNVIGINFGNFATFFCGELRKKRIMLANILDKYSRFYTKDPQTSQQKAQQIEVGNFTCLEQQSVNYDFMFLRIFVLSIIAFSVNSKAQQYVEEKSASINKTAFASNSTASGAVGNEQLSRRVSTQGGYQYGGLQNQLAARASQYNSTQTAL